MVINNTGTLLAVHGKSPASHRVSARSITRSVFVRRNDREANFNHGVLGLAGRAPIIRQAWHGAGIIIAGLLLLVGCSNRPPEISLATTDADRLLYERGLAALEEERWVDARDYFIQIRDNYPQSGFRADARVSVPDTYMGEGTTSAYIQAVIEYRDFLSLYPTHARAPYAQYQLGMVFYHQMRRPERDQSETRDAIREFEIFIQRYTDSNLIGEVRTRIRECRDRLSDSSFMIGRYYSRSKWYPGAIDRFRSILDVDPGYTGRSAVYYHLADALQATGEEAEALPLLERLVEEYPETEYLKQATESIATLKSKLTLQNPDEQDR